MADSDGGGRSQPDPVLASSERLKLAGNKKLTAGYFAF